MRQGGIGEQWKLNFYPRPPVAGPCRDDFIKAMGQKKLMRRFHIEAIAVNPQECMRQRTG